MMWPKVIIIAALASVIPAAPEWHYCYECSGQSALCRESVYDGQYLSKTACSSTCFLRYEGETVYRGCFDGWLGGLVDHDYQGCQTQEYLGEKVEWCFCKGYDDQPCNGNSRDDLSELGPKEPVGSSKQNASEIIKPSGKDKNGTTEVKSDVLKEIPHPHEPPKYFEYHEAEGLEDDDKTDVFQITYEDQRQAPLPTPVFPSIPSPSPPLEEITVDDGGYGVENAMEASKLAANKLGLFNRAPNEVYPEKPEVSGDRFMCSNQDGSYPDPEDCAAYYQCSHGRPYHMMCGAGTVWNDALKGCSFTYTTSAPCRMPYDFKRLVSVWAGYTPWQYMGYNFHNVATDDPPHYLKNDKKLYETFYGDFNAV